MATEAWVPSAEGLQQLLDLFRRSQNASNDEHRQIQQQLVGFNVIPDYNSYLTYILNCATENSSVRQLAGLMLKNNIREHWASLQPTVQRCVCLSLSTAPRGRPVGTGRGRPAAAKR